MDKSEATWQGWRRLASDADKARAMGLILSRRMGRTGPYQPAEKGVVAALWSNFEGNLTLAEKAVILREVSLSLLSSRVPREETQLGLFDEEPVDTDDEEVTKDSSDELPDTEIRRAVPPHKGRLPRNESVEVVTSTQIVIDPDGREISVAAERLEFLRFILVHPHTKSRFLPKEFANGDIVRLSRAREYLREWRASKYIVEVSGQGVDACFKLSPQAFQDIGLHSSMPSVPQEASPG